MSIHHKLPGLHTVLPPKGSPLLSTRIVESKSPLLQERPGRRRIWELHHNFHCSVIGTCLTTGELRHALEKLDLPGIDKETDHQLHGRAVGLACKQEIGAKLLQKALDKRHAGVIKRYAKARTHVEVGELWSQSVKDADIPGAYWAVLTHPETDEDLVKKVFGEVHMLSHLVGAANRADLRRLREQELQINALEEKIRRQERHLSVANTQKTALFNEVETLRMAARAQPEALSSRHSVAPEIEALHIRADTGSRRSAQFAKRLKDMEDVIDDAKKELQRRAHREGVLLAELSACEQAWQSAFSDDESADAPDSLNLGGLSILYVGGRLHQVAQMRKMTELWHGEFLYHDGGVDERIGRLEALSVRATHVLFPVDCVSHNAIAVIKRVIAQSGGAYHALRSAGLTTYVAALCRIAEAERSAAEPQEPFAG